MPRSRVLGLSASGTPTATMASTPSSASPQPPSNRDKLNRTHARTASPDNQAAAAMRLGLTTRSPISMPLILLCSRGCVRYAVGLDWPLAGARC